MDNDVDRLRRLYQGYAERPRPGGREGCPTVPEMVSSFEASAPARLKERIVDHLSSCPACREEFMILVERERQEAPAPEAGPGREEAPPAKAGVPKGAGRVPLWRLAGALTGLALIVVSLINVRRQWELSSALRGARPAIALLSPRNGQAVSGPFVFRWESRLGAGSYVLDIFDEAMLPVWSSGEIPGSSFRVASETIASLSAGKNYYWMVTGFAGRAKAGESPLGRFTVSRR